MISISSLMVVLFSGFIQGCLYALMSSGVTFEWGIAKDLNFTLGAMATWGAYIVWSFLYAPAFKLGYVESILVMISIAFLAGLVLNHLVLRRLRHKVNADINIFVATLGIATFLENAALLVFGGRLKRLPPLLEGTVNLGPVNVTLHRILIACVALSILVVLGLFLSRTRIGMATRAVAQDKEAALLMGINVERSYAIAVGVAMVFVAMAGVLLGSILFVTPTMGTTPLLKAFFVVVLGGLGSIKGTVYAAFIIGEIEAISMYVLGIFWASPVLFSIMIIILLIKPEGLYGEKEIS